MNRDEALIALGQGKKVGINYGKSLFWFLQGDCLVVSNGQQLLKADCLPLSPEGWYVVEERHVIPAGMQIFPPSPRLEARLAYLELLHKVQWGPDQVISWPLADEADRHMKKGWI